MDTTIKNTLLAAMVAAVLCAAAFPIRGRHKGT